MQTASLKLTSTSWNDDRTIVSFDYDMTAPNGDEFSLSETLEFPLPVSATHAIACLEKALHIALAMSYYKAFVPPAIEHPYDITQTEADFWNSVYHSGLGEFTYKNKLDPAQIASFSPQSGISPQGSDDDPLREHILLALGGGKDSIVGGELLKEAGYQMDGYVMVTGERLGQTQAVADVMEVPLHQVKRRLDQQIMDINARSDSYNGHIPISVIFGLVGCMLATAKGMKYVAVGNEASASIPQVTIGDTGINHQWSKSLEFERLLQHYLRDVLQVEVEYFSAVRRMGSIEITRAISRLPQYFEVFTSDNSLFKMHPEQRQHPRWTPGSSKTLSSYLLFAPWLSDYELSTIFGKDYLSDASHYPMLKRLLGEGEPVLDCVGTPDELRLSLQSLSAEGRVSGELQQLANGFTTDLDMAQALQPADEHAIPTSIQTKLESVLASWK